MELQSPLLESLHGLSKSIDDKVHLLASKGDENLSNLALEVTKHLFDLGVTLEQNSHAQIHPFLESIAEPTPIMLRSFTKGKKEASPPRMEPENVLPHTPLSELTTSGLETEQIWEQLEMRAPGYIKVAKEIISAGGRQPIDEDEEAMENEEAEGGSDDEDDMDEDEFRKMLEDGELGDMTDEQFEEMMRKAEEEDEEEDGSDDEESGSDLEDEDEDDEGSSLEGSEEDGEIEFEDGTKIGDSDDDEELLDDEDEDEEEDEDDLEDADEDIEMGSDEEASLGEDDDAGEGEAGPSRRRRHPTLDDQFFSIDDFNRMTEEAEATSLSSGRLDDDEDEELDEDVGQLMLNGVGDDEGIMYTDFFDAPRTVQKPVGKSKKAKVMDVKKGKKGKGKGVKFDEEEEEEEDVPEDDAREVMGRFKEDLFADDDEEEAEDNQPMSTFEKRQKALADQIAQYEQEAVGPKDWTLLGEASSRARPENSLLEEDLDFEHVRKVTPVITEEVVKSLEELIKKRILDNDFNSTVRVRAYEPTPFLASRYFELQDKQSSKSLAEIYEEEYQSAQAGGKGVDPRDAKLKKDHQEIEDLWNDICYKLDALSSLNFVPKQPKAQITTISNLPTTSMETALPATSTASTMLAPEELLNPATASSLVARSELTPEEAQHARDKKRKAKKQDRKHLGDMAELYSKSKKGGAKGEKERALQGLVKSGKGVTVVGKSEKEMSKGRKRGSGGDEAAREDGKRLKL